MNRYCFNKILGHIQMNPKLYDCNFREYYIACHEICTVAQNAGYPFVSLDGNMYLYTGTHLESVDGHELMVFLKEAYRRLSGDDMASGKKELVNGLSSQFPYTVMGLNIKQADEKINFRNGTLDLKSGMLCKHNWADYFRYVLPYDYDKDATYPLFTRYLNEVMPEKEAQCVLAEYVGCLFPD